MENKDNEINKKNLNKDIEKNKNKEKNKDLNKKSNLNEKIKNVVDNLSKKKTKENKEEIKITPEEKIKLLEKEIIELKTDKLRCLADFENFRKRKEEEIIQARERGIISFVNDMLPAIDNFEMSLKMTDNTEMFVKGVEMIHKNLIDILKEHKIEPFEPEKGDEFNPHEHDPILVENENEKENKVINVIKKGFKHGDKIIRPARVQVKKIKEKNTNEKTNSN